TDQVRADHQPEDRPGTAPDRAARAACSRRRADRMRRRQFIALFGGAAAWPVVARAQRRLPTIGILGSASAVAMAPWVTACVQRLRALGWIEGRTGNIEIRWADGRPERIAEIAAEFARLHVDVIITT